MTAKSEASAWTRDRIVAEIKRLAALKGGVAPTWRAFRQHFETTDPIGNHDWYARFWDNWGDAQEEAGYERGARDAFKKRFADDHLIEQFVRLMRDPQVRAKRADGIPLQADFLRYRSEHSDFPSTDAFGRLGAKFQRLSAVLDFCLQRDGYDDIAETIKQSNGFTEWLEKQPAPGSRVVRLDGFVYLLKAGKHYKIGHTNSVARRSAEIKIEMPERCIEIHRIQTDDAPGIEAYWHRRFADKRTNGEWFRLTADDVKAFKRRKTFM